MSEKQPEPEPIWFCAIKSCGFRGPLNAFPLRDFGKFGPSHVCPKCGTEDVFSTDDPVDDPGPPKLQYVEDDDIDF